jgi:hypothetical protein
MADVTEAIDLRLEGEAAAAARQLAELRGISLPDAVGEALRHYMEWERTRPERVADILRIAAEVRATLRHPLPTSNHDWLYDEHGLPI